MANNDGSNKLRSLVDSRNVDSLELTRLYGGSWGNVAAIVKMDNYEGKPRVTVRGSLHGPKRRRSLFLLRKVELEIVADTSAHHELLNQTRALIVPGNYFRNLLSVYATINFG